MTKMAGKTRGMVGTYHKCDPQHLQSYVTEFEFRFNNSVGLGINDKIRAHSFLSGAKAELRLSTASRGLRTGSKLLSASLLGGSGMVVAEALSGIGAIKTALDMAKALQDIHDAAARDRAVMNLQKEIIAAYSEQTMLAQKAGDLKEEVARLKTWDADKSRYQLTEIRAGSFAYALKEGMEIGEPKHYLCTSCYQGNHKSILIQETWNPGMSRVLVCHDCGWHTYLTGPSHRDHKDLRPKPYRGS